jgi:hypothetical protein
MPCYFKGFMILLHLAVIILKNCGAGWFGGNAVTLYLGGSQFKSQLGHGYTD